MKAPSPLDVTKLSPPVDISDNEAALNGVAEVVAQGPFRDTWESLSGYSVPAWYRDANPRNMYRAGTAEYAHHLATYGTHSEFGYKDFIPPFTMGSSPFGWCI